jgi:EmrB/QacA subfamily drug resistance transporter
MTIRDATPPRQLEVVRAEEESPAKVFSVLALAVFLATLDMFIVNVAVPAIQRGFHGTGVEGVSWVLNAYAIVFAALLVPAGKLGDVIGRRRVFMSGLAAFGLGSALCAVAPSLEFLIGARALQGAGAAAVTPTSLGLLLPTVSKSARPAAIGAWAGIGAVGAAAGPPLGGLLTELSWHWIFIVNVPLTLIALVASFRVLPEVRDPARPPLPDLVGTVLLIASVALATLGLVKGSAWNWDGRVIACIGAALALAAAFVARSRRHPSPVLELSILRRPAFALASLSAALFFASFSVMLLGNVLFLTGVWHYSVLRAGLALTPGPIAAAAVAPFAGRLAARVGPGPVGGAGALLFAIGTVLWLTFVGVQPDYFSHFLPSMLIGGVGVGLALPAFTIAATRVLPPQLLATGIGAQIMFRQIGGTLGVAAFVAILGTPTASDVMTGYDATRWFMLATTLTAGLALMFIRPTASDAATAGAPAATPSGAAPPVEVADAAASR